MPSFFHSWRHGVLVAVCVFFAASPAARAAQGGVPPFQAGDRVCFVGDSITAGGVYASFLKMFYATRYPERDIEFLNCGKSGGSAKDALTRVSWDVLEHRPTSALVAFGMNDMTRLFLAASGSQEALDRDIEERLRVVEERYERLLEVLEGAAVCLTLVGPSPYDETLQVDTKIERSNWAMTRWTERLGQMAARRGAAFVDLGAVMNPLNARLQKVDPAASIVGKDRVHPGLAGHLLMAYTILKAQNVEPDVAIIRLDAKGLKVGELVNCSVEGLRSHGQGVEFGCLEKALPFVLPQEGGMQGPKFWGIAARAAAQLEAEQGSALIPFQDELNREILQVTGLEAGQYEVRIDDVAVGVFGADALSAGISLGDNPKTPQYAQALELAKAFEAYRVLDASFFRLIAHVRSSILEPEGVDVRDAEAVERCLKEALVKRKPEDYARGMAERYLKTVPGQRELKLQERDAFTLKIQQLKRPVPHRYRVARIADSGVQ